VEGRLFDPLPDTIVRVNSIINPEALKLAHDVVGCIDFRRLAERLSVGCGWQAGIEKVMRMAMHAVWLIVRMHLRTEWQRREIDQQVLSLYWESNCSSDASEIRMVAMHMSVMYSNHLRTG
jgi:hypothetical protein